VSAAGAFLFLYLSAIVVVLFFWGFFSTPALCNN
jgi:hypothetical protein